LGGKKEGKKVKNEKVDQKGPEKWWGGSGFLLKKEKRKGKQSLTNY